MRRIALALPILVVLSAAAAAAEPPIPWEKLPTAADLERAERGVVERALRRERSYGSCTDVLARCLAAGDRTALRLARYVVYLVQRRTPDAEMAALIAQRKSSVYPARTFTFETTGAPTLGPDSAPVTVVEFADFECPFCGASLPEMKRLVERFPGKVRLVFKQFPLQFHAGAVPAARAALAAHRQGKFWPMADRLMADMEHHARGDLIAHARAIGLDAARFERDLDDKALLERIERDKIEGIRAGVDGTPTIFVNGKRFLLHKDPWLLRERIEEELDLLAGRR